MKSLEQIAGEAITDIRSAIEEGAKARGKVASGATINSIQTAVFTAQGFAEAVLTADHQWRYVGNGRGPGKMPPVENIAKWVQATGRNISPWAVAKGIAKRGTFDFRAGRPNVFLAEIDGWMQGKVSKVEEAVADHGADRVVNLFKTSLKNG